MPSDTSCTYSFVRIAAFADLTVPDLLVGENLEVQHRAGANQRTDTTTGISGRRLFESDEDPNESARMGFLVGTASTMTGVIVTTG